MTTENEKWIKSEEGNEEYLLWMTELAERAKKITNKDIQISKDGEILVPVILKKEELPIAIKRHPDFCSHGNTTFIIEFRVKDIILSEIESIGKKRNELREEDDGCEFLFSDEDIYKEIEKAIVQDMCVKAMQAKEFAIQSFEKATSYNVSKKTNGIVITPNFNEEEVKNEVNNKKNPRFIRKILGKVWRWIN